MPVVSIYCIDILILPPSIVGITLFCAVNNSSGPAVEKFYPEAWLIKFLLITWMCNLTFVGVCLFVCSFVWFGACVCGFLTFLFVCLFWDLFLFVCFLN